MDSSSSSSPLAWESWGRVARLAQKELRETLRDRRTLGTLVLMPLLVYPLLNFAFEKLLLSRAAEQRHAFNIGVESELHKQVLREYLEWGEAVLAEAATAQGEEPEGPAQSLSVLPDEHERAPRFELFELGEHLERTLGGLDIDLAVRMDLYTPLEGSRRPGPIDCQLIYRPNSPSSEAALRFVEERLRAVNEQWLEERLRPLGVERIHYAYFVRRMLPGDEAPPLLATLAPLILILMTMTGAVYPAIDLTAGERERGTLETLIAAPVPRMSLLLAKYVAVLAVALLTAMVNFLAMTITVASGGLGPYLFGTAGLSLATVAQVFALTILFAAFFSAVLLAVTSFARSFKEAQAYLIPLTLLSLAPGFLAFTPGLELNGALALAPLANMVLVARDMLQGGVEPLWLIVAVAATVVYALAALSAAARIFGADALLFGAEESWTAWLRRPAQPRTAAPLDNALICLGALLPCYLLLSSWLIQLSELPLAARLLVAGFLTSLLFGFLPLAAAFLGRVSVREGFALRGASPWGFLGAAVLGLSLWPFAHEIFLLNERLGLVSLDEESLQPARRLIEQLPDVPLWLVLAAVAVAPAAFEEFFFRGYLFGAVRAQGGGRQTIVLTALLFGAFHVVAGRLTFERMLPSTFLGLVLGWVRARTGSVLPGMLLHVFHNGFLMLVAYYRDGLTAWGWGLQEQSHLPPAWLAAAAMATAAGIALVLAGGRRSTQNEFQSVPSQRTE